MSIYSIFLKFSIFEKTCPISFLIGEYSFSQNFGIDPIGVCHADDLIYLWGLPTWPIGTLNDADEEMRSMMTTVWTNFAKVSC